MRLDKACGDFAPVVVVDVEGDILRSPVVHESLRRYRPVFRYGCACKSRSPSGVILWRQLERFDVENLNWSSPSRLITSASPSTMSSSYVHPFGKVGRRKRNGIFVVFVDIGGVVVQRVVVLEDGLDEVPSQRFGLATSAFRCDHAWG